MTTRSQHSNWRLDPTEAATSVGAMWKASTLDLPLALWSETLRFMAHRLQADADYVASLNHCKTISEALERQASFTQKAVADYAAETSTLMKEASSVVKLPETPRAPMAA